MGTDTLRPPRNLRLLLTTKADDNPIAAPAMSGLSRPSSSIGDTGGELSGDVQADVRDDENPSRTHLDRFGVVDHDGAVQATGDERIVAGAGRG